MVWQFMGIPMGFRFMGIGEPFREGQGLCSDLPPLEQEHKHPRKVQKDQKPPVFALPAPAGNPKGLVPAEMVT